MKCDPVMKIDYCHLEYVDETHIYNISKSKTKYIYYIILLIKSVELIFGIRCQDTRILLKSGEVLLVTEKGCGKVFDFL